MLRNALVPRVVRSTISVDTSLMSASRFLNDRCEPIWLSLRIRRRSSGGTQRLGVAISNSTIWGFHADTHAVEYESSVSRNQRRPLIAAHNNGMRPSGGGAPFQLAASLAATG